MPNRNEPYSRPINATRLEGQMLQGEFYGDKASDKVLHQATGGRAVHQVRPMSSVVPAWPDQQPTQSAPPQPKRGRPPGSKNRVKATIDDIAPLDEIDPPSTLPNSDATSPSDDATRVTDAITEDDLFG